MERGGAPRSSSFWLWNVTAWLGIGLLGATQTVFVMRSAGMHHAWATLFFTELLSWAPWAVATPLVIGIGRRYPPATVRSLSRVLIHVGTAAAILVTWAAWVALLEWVMNPWAMPHPPSLFRLWLMRVEIRSLQTVFLYAGIFATSSVLDTRDRLVRQDAEAARLNDQLTRARLHALQQQLEPHFLFNALNAVAALVRERRNDTAVRAIAELSDCLRRVLREADSQLVPLGRELEFVERYLDLQKLRFGDALQVAIEVPGDLLAYEVPSVVLQPIVDNAIKHGISQRVDGGTVHIGASRSDSMLTLTVYNDGPRVGTRPGFDLGTGFVNLRARLGMLYGTAFHLTIDNVDAGVRVALSLPLKS